MTWLHSLEAQFNENDHTLTTAITVTLIFRYAIQVASRVKLTDITQRCGGHVFRASL